MRKERLMIVIATVLIVAIAVAILLPLYKDNASLGLDLQGGVLVRLEAPAGTSDEDMEGAIKVIQNRIDALGVSEPDVRREGISRISVELPGVEDPEEAVNLIGKTAQMMFVRYDTGEIVLHGSDLKHADAATNNEAMNLNEMYVVNLDFNDQGAKVFAEVTQELISKYPNESDPNRIIMIVLDDQIVSAPSVKHVISNGKAQISGSYETLEAARNDAMLLNSGALPVELEIIEKRTVGAQLGKDSIAKSLNAAMIGAILLAIFMVAAYRLPGVIALVSLTVYGLLVAGAMVLINVSITLPAIAGFLLSVGMGVDGNVIIYERIKEELRDGKTLRAAVDSGFKKAFATIFDSNVTTLIASIVLIFLGSGPVRGFAITLTIGILASMFTAITFTKFVLKNLVASGVVKNTKWFGV